MAVARGTPRSRCPRGSRDAHARPPRMGSALSLCARYALCSSTFTHTKVGGASSTPLREKSDGGNRPEQTATSESSGTIRGQTVTMPIA